MALQKGIQNVKKFDMYKLYVLSNLIHAIKILYSLT